MKRRKPPTPPREDYTLVEFTNSKIAPMRDLIVCCTPSSTVLRARLLARFTQWWDSKALAVDLVAEQQQPETAYPVTTLEIRASGSLIATATAIPLDVQLPADRICPRCSAATAYELVDVTRMSSDLVTVMTACRSCGWRSSAAEYDLGRTA